MGRLTSCETITPNTQFWGDITNGVTDDNEKNRWIEITPIKEKCKTCHFYHHVRHSACVPMIITIA